MDSPYNHVIPNMNAEEYRNLSEADRPPLPDKQLEVIKVFKDESLFVGASNMTDRKWNGTLWYFNKVDNFNKDDPYGAMRTESGISDAAYLGQHDTFVIGEDSGSIQIVRLLNTESEMCYLKNFDSLHFACQHDDSLISLSVFENSTSIVSGGMDCCIKVWNISDTLQSEHTYDSAHCDTVTCVNVQPRSNFVFASTSMDSEALTWDVRNSKPAHGLFKKSNCGLTAIAWKPDDENIVAIGAEDGSISVIDIRKPKSEIIQDIIFDRGVYKLEFNPLIPNQLAGCCDGNIIQVVNIEKNLAIIYDDSRHQDFVRGLAWHKKELLSCSWDNNILSHSIEKL